MPRKVEQTNTPAYQSPRRFFEYSGAVNPKEAYYVPFRDVSSARKQDIKSMVDGGRYFSIFAPRQSGKTTYLVPDRKPLFLAAPAKK